MSVSICALCGAVQGGTAVHEATCRRGFIPFPQPSQGFLDFISTLDKQTDQFRHFMRIEALMFAQYNRIARVLPAHCWDSGRDVCDGSDPRPGHCTGHALRRPEATRDAPHHYARATQLGATWEDPKAW